MTQDLSRRAVQGVAWLGSGQMLRMVMSFGASLLLVRLLSPADFGLFGMTYMAAELAQLFAAFGFGSAIIQQQTSKPSVLSSCFWTNLVIGSAVALCLIAAAPFVAIYFQRAELTPLVIPLALNLVLGAALVVPQALLTQRLQFRQLTLAQTGGSLVSALAAVGAALAGAGVWALALQPLVGNLVTLCLMLVFSHWRPGCTFDLGEVRPLLRFSTGLLANNLVDFVARNLPVLIIGRVLGATALGFYSMATGLTGAVIFQISSVIVRVLFPALSALKAEPDRMGDAWLKANSAIALLAWPLMAGAIALASDLIPVVFGAQWLPAVVPFQVLCGLMAVQAVAATASTVLMAHGRADLLLRVTIASALVIAAALWLGTYRGITGVAVGYALAGTASALVYTSVAAHLAQVRVTSLLQDLRPWALAAIVTGLLMSGVHALSGEAPPSMRLALGMATGLASYPAMLWLLARQRTLGLLTDVGGRLFRRGGSVQL